MHLLLAKTPPWIQTLKGFGESVKELFGAFGILGNIVLALIIFLLLKMAAGILRDVFKKTLKKISFDEKVASKLGYQSEVTQMLSTILYLVLVIYAAVIALGVAELEDASRPLQGMLNDLIGYVDNIIGAGILLYILLFVANVVKQLLANILDVAKLDERVGSTTGTPIANSLVTAAYGFLVLLFIPAVLDVLNIEAISEPIQGIVGSITEAVPHVLLAGGIIAIGVLVGQVAARVVSNLLKGTGIDQLPAKVGFKLPEDGKGAISSTIGMVVLVSIVVTVFAAALNELQIEILSGISSMLVGGYYNILLALIVLTAGIVGAKFAHSAIVDKSAVLARLTRYVIIVVSSVVALDRAGIASDLTSLPYQVAIVAAGVAFGIGGAIAIGFGAREYVATWLSKRG